VASLKDTAFDTELNLELLLEIKRYFDTVRSKYGGLIDPIAERTDASVFSHQVPGGMLSNLVHQLKQQNAVDKYEEASLWNEEGQIAQVEGDWEEAIAALSRALSRLPALDFMRNKVMLYVC
jgi:pyruvate/oxaloacetate carboxyltransferase